MRHETLEPRILYSASPLEEPPPVPDAPPVAQQQGPDAGSQGSGEGSGPAPVTQDQTPPVDAESGVNPEGDLATILQGVQDLPAGEVQSLVSNQLSLEIQMQGHIDWSQMGLPTDQPGTIHIRGTDHTDDLLSLDLSQFSTSLDLYFDGGAGGFDVLKITGVTSGGYTPGAQAGEGVLVFGNHRIQFSGVEPVIIEGTGEGASFTFTTPHGVDDLVLDSPADGWSRIRGTSGGVAFEELVFSNVEQVIVDAMSHDAPGESADEVTVATDLRAVACGSSPSSPGRGMTPWFSGPTISRHPSLAGASPLTAGLEMTASSVLVQIRPGW